MLVKVKEVLHETLDTVTLVLDLPRFVQYKPGQFVTVSVQINGATYTRAYSFSSTPYIDKYPMLTIKSVESGMVSNYLQQLSPQSFIDISEPKGNFTPVDRGVYSHYVLFAGGSGITPLFGIIKHLLYQNHEAKVTLFYANKNVNSIIFHEQLIHLQEQFNNRFFVVYFIDDVTLSDWAIKGPFTITKGVKFLNKIYTQFGTENISYWLCGPNGLNKVAIDTLHFMKVPNHLIHQESFAGEGDNSILKFSKMVKLSIIKQNATHKIKIDSGQYILSQILSRQIDVPYSCMNAGCGSCKVKLLKGEIKMEQNYALHESEIASGYRLLCKGIVISDEAEISYIF